MAFPEYRARRLRDHPIFRDMVAETTLAPQYLVQPLFVKEAIDSRQPIKSMPGQTQLGMNELVAEAARVHDAGVPAVLLFGIPREKDATGSSATRPDGIIQQAVRAMDHNWALATANVGDMAPGGLNEIDSGVYWWSNIDYQGSMLSVQIGLPPFVWFDLFSVPVDISAIVGSDTAYVGFTGGTGLAHANHDVCSWSFVPEPATLSLLAVGGLSLVLRRRR